MNKVSRNELSKLRALSVTMPFSIIIVTNQGGAAILSSRYRPISTSVSTASIGTLWSSRSLIGSDRAIVARGFRSLNVLWSDRRR